MTIKDHMNALIDGYVRIFGETDSVGAFRVFLNAFDDVTSRQNLTGHITGSAIVWHRKSNSILRVHHAKLNVWVFSGGGHIDAGELPWQASVRELREETGVTAKPLYDTQNPVPLILDAHPIVASLKKSEPAHWHYDVVYLYEVAEKPELRLDPTEAKDFRWEDVATVTKAVHLAEQMRTYGVVESSE